VWLMFQNGSKCQKKSRPKAALKFKTDDRLAAGRRVLSPKLACGLANFGNFVLRPQPNEVYMVESAGRHHSAGNGRCCTGIRHIEDYQDARAFRSRAVHRNQFSTSGLGKPTGEVFTE
jgi:hypothetical protein